ncbi:MAG: rhodanese [Planctomycetes bacterium]|jgi:rhodanese-related sulfurtransferase|nr:rhodanese [Planctomycetota bacterium]
MEVDVATVKSWIDRGSDDRGVPVFLLDCRETDEYQTANIQPSHLAPLSQWPPAPDIIEAMHGNQVVVYCHHGGRSLRAASWLRQNGFPDALSMAGGIDLWSRVVDPSVPRY